jgi:hypothetical protein
MLQSLFGGRSIASLRPSDASKLRVCGLVSAERELGVEELRAIPAEFQIAEIGHFAKGLRGQAVRLKGLMAFAGVKPNAMYLNAGARDGKLRLALFRWEVEALALVVYAHDGGALSAAQGGPFRLVIPGYHDAARDLHDLAWLEFSKRAAPDTRAEFAHTRRIVVGQQAFDANLTWRDPRDADTIVIPPPNA